MFDTDGVLIFVDSALNEIIFLVSLPLLQVITQETKEFTPRFAQTALFIIALVTMPLFIPLNFLEDPKQLALPSFKLSTNDSLLTKYNLMQLLITILDRFIDMCFDLKHTIPLILHLVLLNATPPSHSSLAKIHSSSSTSIAFTIIENISTMFMFLSSSLFAPTLLELGKTDEEIHTHLPPTCFTHTQSHQHICTSTHSRTHTPARAHILTPARPHTFSRTRTPAHSRTHTHTHALAHSHTYAHTLTHTPTSIENIISFLAFIRNAVLSLIPKGILTILMLVTVDHIIQGILDDFVDKTLNTFVTTCSNQTELIIQKKMAESKKNNEKNSTVSTNKSFTIHSNKSTVRRARRKQADSSHTQFVHSLLIIPLAHILRIVPTAHIVHIVPTAHILRIVPSAHIVHIVPSAHIVHIVPSAHILRIVPTAHIVHIVPSAHILRIVPSAHILRIVPSRTSFASSLPRTSFASSLPRTSFTSSLPRTSFASSPRAHPSHRPFRAHPSHRPYRAHRSHRPFRAHPSHRPPRPQRSHRSSLAISDLFHLLVSSLFIQIAQNLIASNLSLSQRIVGLGKEQKTIMITTTSPHCVPTLQLIHDCVVAAINIVHVLRSSNASRLRGWKALLARPSLIVPETFSSTPLVVISVSNSSLTLTDVDALIRSSSLDLKLVRVSSGSFEFSNGMIKYTPSSTANSEIGNADSDLCSWSTGTIELVNSTAFFRSCSLKNLAQGAIMQSGGNVSLRDVYFESNGPTNRDFPSARRNVMCSSDGTLFVGGLTGDGRSHLFPGSGISGDGCSVSGTTTKLSIPFLDTYHSQITLDKSSGKYLLYLIGSGFLPCGLQLEVFTSSEDGNSEESSTLAVDTSTASLFSETRIEFFVTPKDVGNLSQKSEWKVRLLNGGSLIASQSLVLREKPQSMLWLIPVIVVVVLVIAGVIVALLVIWRCRSKKPVEKKEEMIETTDETPTTEMKDADCDQPETERSVEQAINVSDTKE
ncbi:hypothetical protein BLNAU_21412 [Blattamonas nauphoetae]|uniref:Uncharacterized protein n=1 Tax=Blattamonas nauphoetae TaxID=2049346 RepID=A0ABQ9WVZ7_9EUKA|nr:hypothetical protein BLNAU_21412 [Blattamonas nauphoetae]